VIDVLGGRVADARVGATLRGHREIERAARGLHGHANRQFLAVGLDVLVESRIELHVAGRNLRVAERRRAAVCHVARRKGEALPIHVVAIGDLEVHIDHARLFARAEGEGLIGRQEVVVGMGGCRAEQQRQQAADEREEGQQRGVRRGAQAPIEAVRHGGDAGFRC
jgi:hypothetical protein